MACSLETRRPLCSARRIICDIGGADYSLHIYRTVEGKLVLFLARRGLLAPLKLSFWRVWHIFYTVYTWARFVLTENATLMHMEYKVELAQIWIILKKLAMWHSNST